MSSFYESAFTDLNSTISFGGGGGRGGNSAGRNRQNNAARKRQQDRDAAAQRNRDVRDHVFSNVIQGTTVTGSVGTDGVKAGVRVTSNCTSCHHPRDPFAN